MPVEIKPLRLPVSRSSPSLGSSGSAQLQRPTSHPSSSGYSGLDGIDPLGTTSLAENKRTVHTKRRMTVEKLESFLQRQCAGSWEIRRDASMWQRGIRSEALEEERRWCPRGADGLRKNLLRQYCSISEAWCHAIDKQGAGKICFMEMCQACRELGYGGNIKKLWIELDTDLDGSVSLLDLDPEGRTAVSSFVSFLVGKFGSTVQGWKEGLAVFREDMLEEKDFVNRCFAMGYQGDAPKLFGWLLGKRGKHITLRDIDPQAVTTLKDCGHDVGNFSPARSNAVKLKKPTEDEADCGIKNAQELRNLLQQRYGSLLTAWRQAIDVHGVGQVTVKQLGAALRNIGFSGSLKKLTAEIDAEKSGFVTFKDFDPKLDAADREYKKLVENMFSNLLNAWFKDLDKTSQGCVDEPTFVEHCANVCFTGDAKQLFRSLQTDRKSKYLCLRDWDTRAYRAFARGDIDMISEDRHVKDKAASSLSFHERQESGFRHRWTQSQVRKERADTSATRKESEDADCGAIGGFESLQRLLIHNYGTVAAAWRQALDPEGLGQLPYKEFAIVLRKIGFRGSFRRLWSDLGVKDTHMGNVTLATLDPEVAAALASLRSQLVAKFGDIITAWNEGLDKNRKGGLEEDKFVKSFCELGLEGDAKMVFTNLQERGRTFIMLTDIEPKALQAWYRGDEKARTLKPARVGQIIPVSPTRPSSALSSTATVAPCERSSPSNASPRSRLSETNRESPPSVASATTRLSEWSQELGLRMRRETQRQQKEEINKMMGCNTLESFKQCLIGKCGSLVGGWRRVLDSAGNGKLSMLEFGQALRELPFTGSTKELFNELGGDAVGHVSLEALDPETGRMFSTLRELLLSRYGCLLDAWNTYIDDGSNIWLNEQEFHTKFSRIGFDAGNPRKWHQLFRSLMPDKYSQHLHLDDLKVLLLGVPHAERRNVWAGSSKATLSRPVSALSRPRSSTGARSRPESAKMQSPLSEASAAGSSRPNSAVEKLVVPSSPAAIC